MSKNSQIKRKEKIAKAKNKESQAQAIINANRSQIATIYLDESGNTGHNLIDIDQPIFTLAGTKHTAPQAERLLRLLECKSPLEAHFKNLKRRKSGQDGVIRLLRHSLINSDLVKVELFDKKFMITTKIVDILIETMMNLNGHDLYINGQNIALSNMWHYCMPSFCGQESVDLMYKAFVKMIKTQDDEDTESFYQSIELLREKCSSEDFKADLIMILSTRGIIKEIFEGIDKSTLDPSIPAFFSQCINWGQIHPKGFYIIHDDSKSIEQQKELFSLFMDLTQKEIELGYDRRKFNLPLKSLSLTFSSSQLHPQLQVADIIASSISYWASGKMRGECSDYFFQELDKLNLDKLLTATRIWPTTHITPEALGTVYKGGLNPADHTAYFLTRARSNQKN